MARYGYFDNETREYVITHPELPQPWHNYISNGSHCGLVTHTGGGASFLKDPLRMRLLRYKFHLTPYDRPGRYAYIRDQDTGEYWSATWSPVCTTPLTKMTFECRVGMGYNRITTGYNGIEAEMLYFVPPDDDLEIWRLTLTNRSKKTRTLRTFSYAEWAVWGVARDLMNIDNAATCARHAYKDGVFWHTTPNDVGTSIGTATWVHPVGYFTSDADPVGYDGSRDHFLGSYRDESRPIVVETGEPTNLCVNGVYPLGSLAHDWTLAPGQSRTITYQLGADMARRPLQARLRKYRNPANVDKAFDKLRTIWTDRLSVLQTRTPDDRFDTMVNTWSPYQVINFGSRARAVSPVSWGSRVSMGFRDEGQGILSVASLNPDGAGKLVRILAHAQHDDGLLTKNFTEDNFEGERGYLDNNAWYPYFIVAYLKETGDFALLDEQFPSVNSGKMMTLLDRVLLAMDVLWKRRGEHGLCATGWADWNDCLNPPDHNSESVLNAMLFCAGAQSLVELFTHLDRLKDAAKWARRRDTMAKAIDEHAWDGAWYRRMFMADTGRILGTKAAKRWGKIFLEPQVWAALCGAVEPARAIKAMDSARKRLATRFGLRILDPPCPEHDPQVGSLGILNMGCKENGSVYSHVNGWAVCAEAALGRGDLAFETWLAYQPISRNDEAELREIEPYVINAQTQAPPFFKPGRGRNSWVTGSSTWNYVAATQYILGVRAQFDGLQIAPCIPSGWDGFETSRRFRGATYHIKVRNPDGVCGGVKHLTVNGKVIEGNVAPLPTRRGQTITVEAQLER